MQYFEDHGENYVFDLDGVEDDKAYYRIQHRDGWSYKAYESKLYFREERTWDDHMGNTPCGYYVKCKLPNGHQRRIYIYA